MDKNSFDLITFGEIMLRLSPPRHARIVDGDIFEKRAVVKFDKAENVGRTHTSYPACNADFLVSVFFCFSENFLDFNTFHILPPLIVKPKFFVQTSVTYRLGDVIGFYVFACVKVGNGARNLYYARMCPCR